MTNVCWLIYFLLCVIDIICAEKKQKRYAKGFLMPFLLLCYVLTAKEKEIDINYFILFALFFGWLGDIALINKTKRNVIIGILTFLIGHIIYALLFIQDIYILFSFKIFGLLIYGIYTYFVIYKLFPNVEKKMIPLTIIYIVIILCMSITAYFRYPKITGVSYYLTWIGSLCFLCSDTILSFEIYAKGSHHGVMILYLFAQTLIVCGYLVC